MTGPRIVLVSLALVAVVFFSGVGVGLSGEGAEPASADWVETLSGLLTRSVDVSTVESPCLDQNERAFVVEAKSMCSATIPAVARGTRRLGLSLDEGSAALVSYVAPEIHERIDNSDDTAAQKVQLEPVKNRGIVVLKEGGSLTITCNATENTRCRITVK